MPPSPVVLKCLFVHEGLGDFMGNDHTQRTYEYSRVCSSSVILLSSLEYTSMDSDFSMPFSKVMIIISSLMTATSKGFWMEKQFIKDSPAGLPNRTDVMLRGFELLRLLRIWE